MRDESLDSLIEKVEEAGYDVIEGEDDLYEVASNMGYSVVGNEDDLKSVAEDMGYRVFKYDGEKRKLKTSVKVWRCPDGSIQLTDISVQRIIQNNEDCEVIYEGKIEGVILEGGEVMIFEEESDRND